MANLRTSNYKGFNYASGSADGAGGGVFLYSGSMVLNPAGTFTSYSGVGMELVGHSESYLRFQSSTSTSPGVLDVRADSFYVGSPSTQFISGSGGSVEISSSNFHLTPTGDLIASNADFDGYAIARSLRQKTVTITQANMHQYCVQLINGDDSNITFHGDTVDTVIAITTKLILDGSLGGEIISHVIIDVDLLSEPPEDSYLIAGELISLGLGTQPSSNFQRTALGSEYFDDGTVTIAASGADLYKSFGGIREIIGPTAADGTKVPVTIEIGDTANVDFYVPIGNAAANSAFGIISQRLENQMAIISPVLREEP
jgi:hypothetical protein